MKIRQALVIQGPSLELQRAASNEIYKLDDLLAQAKDQIEYLQKHFVPDEYREVHYSINTLVRLIENTK